MRIAQGSVGRLVRIDEPSGPPLRQQHPHSHSRQDSREDQVQDPCCFRSAPSRRHPVSDGGIQRECSKVDEREDDCDPEDERTLVDVQHPGELREHERDNEIRLRIQQQQDDAVDEAGRSGIRIFSQDPCTGEAPC